MFDVGFTEILMIGVVALVVIGPERLPDVARTVGRWIGKMQRFVRGVKTDLASELESGDLKKLIGSQREQIDELRKIVKTTKREIETSTTDLVQGAKKKFGELENAAATVDAEASTPRIGAEPSIADAGVGAPGGELAADSEPGLPTKATIAASDDPSKGTEATTSDSGKVRKASPSQAAEQPDDLDTRSDGENA